MLADEYALTHTHVFIPRPEKEIPKVVKRFASPDKSRFPVSHVGENKGAVRNPDKWCVYCKK